MKPQDTLAAVERLSEELAETKARAGALEAAVFDAIAAEHAGKGDVLLFQPPMKGDSVRRLADAVARRSGGLAAVFAGEGEQFAYALVQSEGRIFPLW